MKYPGSITDITGIKVGHSVDTVGVTGCTMVVFDRLMQASVDVRGGAAGTLNTDALEPTTSCGVLDAVLLSGGSNFGLGSMSGAMEWMEAHGRGFDALIKKVPIVCGAIIFDLEVGDSNARPTPKMAWEACENAKSETAQGLVGAGYGARVGKVFVTAGMEDGGLGTACIDLGDGLKVAALAVVNAMGDIYDGERRVAGVHDANGNPVNGLDAMLQGAKAEIFGQNTTIAVVATNLKMDRGMTQKLAMMAHDGYALAIRPVHTLADGDTVFSVTTGEIDAPDAINRVMAAAAEAMRRAIVNACDKQN